MTRVFQPISRVNLHSEVMQRLTEAIRNGTWAPGGKLPGELGLAKQFGVSRTCIREALKAMAFAGFVETRSGVGTFVLDNQGMSPQDIEVFSLLSSPRYTEILDVRKLIEGQAAYWAAQRATDEDIDELRMILEDDTPSLKEKHTLFHEKVGELSKNSVLIGMLRQLQNTIRPQREMNFIMLPDEDRLEHWKVFDAIASRSPSFARQAMLHHIDYFWKK